MGIIVGNPKTSQALYEKDQRRASDFAGQPGSSVKGDEVIPAMGEWSQSRTDPKYWSNFYGDVLPWYAQGGKEKTVVAVDPYSGETITPPGDFLSAYYPPGKSLTATTPGEFDPGDPMLAENGVMVGPNGRLQPLAGSNPAVKAAMTASAGQPALPTPYRGSNGFWYLPQGSGAPKSLGRDLYQFRQANPGVQFNLPSDPRYPGERPLFGGPGTELDYRIQQLTALSNGQPVRAMWGGGPTPSEAYDLANAGAYRPPAPEGTVRGSSTGQLYKVGQTYQGTNGYTYEAQPDGTFKQTGKADAYSQMTPSQQYAAVNANAAAAAAAKAGSYTPSGGGGGVSSMATAEYSGSPFW